MAINFQHQRLTFHAYKKLVTAGFLGVLIFGAGLFPVFAGDSLVGKVIAIKSANLITLDYGSGTEEIRIAGIEVDTRDVMAREAKTALSNLILGKTVRLRFDGYLPNGEMAGRIWLGGIAKPDEPVKDVGLELVRAGMVRSAKGYGGYKYSEMVKAEDEARQNKRGLWK